MKAFRRILSLVLVLSMLISIPMLTSKNVEALYSFTIQKQNVEKWRNVYVNSGSLYNTGCGIFSLINAVGCLTGKDMGVESVARWAYSVGGYNVEGAEGTYRTVLYRKVEAKYGATYGFTLDCNGGEGYWAGSSSSTLKNHLKNGGVAVGHVPNHFIAILEYNSTSNKYHIYDSYPTSSRGTLSSGGDCWVTPSQLASGSLYLDWFCLLEKGNDGPEVTISPTTIKNGTEVTVSWSKVDGASSYWYRVNQYHSEVSGRDLIPYTQIIPKTETTSRSITFTVPEDTTKYLRISIGATGTSLNVSTTKTVPVGGNVTAPTDMTAIKIDAINADTTDGGQTLIWNSKKDEAFTATWWPAAKCALQEDGTYKVTKVYESGTERSVSLSGGDIIIASHADATDKTSYNRVKKLAVGDVITLHGLYLDYKLIKGEGFALVNGTINGDTTLTAPSQIAYNTPTTVTWTPVDGATSYNIIVKVDGTTLINEKGVTDTSYTIPAQTSGAELYFRVQPANSVFKGNKTSVYIPLIAVPTDITVGNTESGVSKSETDPNCYRGFKKQTTATAALTVFAEDASYLQIKDEAGNTVESDAVICTGYTVNIFDGTSVTKSYTVVVEGDVNGDGTTTSADTLAQSSHLQAKAPLDGAYLTAADFDANGSVTSSDYLSLVKEFANGN